MKRIFAPLLALLILTGCAGNTPIPTPPQAETPPPTEEAFVPEETPEQDTASTSSPGTDDPSTEQPAELSAEAQAGSDVLAAKAAAVYAAVTEGAFTLSVTEPGGTTTTLEILPGVNDWNVQGRENTFSYTYRWSEAAAEDWDTQCTAAAIGNTVTLAASEELRISCCANGDVIEFTDHGSVMYLRAVNPKEGQEPFEWSFCGAMTMLASDVLAYEMWNVTADGGLHPQEAAAQMLEQIAANYRAAPDWALWKPLDTRAGEADVFDIYWGEPQAFCCGMSLRLQFDDYHGERANRWQAGAGLSEPDGDGYCGYGAEVVVRKNADGDWQYEERGSGGYSVDPQNTEGKPQLEWLVEVFCLTEGFTHDWRTPYHILDLGEEELSRLPAILDRLTEAEARELCTALGRCLREYDYWEWSVELLAPLLGDYGAWLDA